MLKIYFGDKPLILASDITDEIKAYENDENTSILKTDNQDGIRAMIRDLSNEKLTAGIVLGNPSEVLDNIKKEFTVIMASGGMVYSSENILLIYRRGKWDLPKGKLDEGEDIVDGALREVREETGLDYLEYTDFIATSYHTYFEDSRHILKESHWYLLKGSEKEMLTPQTDEDIEKCE